MNHLSGVGLTVQVAAAILLAVPALAVQPLSRERTLELVDRFAAAELEKPGRVGLAIAVAVGESVVVDKGYGFIELEHKTPATTHAVFRVGSVTKPFTAALVMRFVERGEIDLDAPIGRYVPFGKVGESVTVRHLLTHTSGIKSYTRVGEAFDKYAALERPAGEVLALVETTELEFRPGEGFSYSNTNYFLLGRLVERVAGKPYAKLLKSELCDPSGLRNTRYDSNADIIPNRAQGYTLLGGRLVNDAPLGVSQPFAAGGLLSTAGDLVRWELALASGRVVSRASLDLMNTPAELPRETEPYFRYGFGRIVSDWDGEPVIFHGGGINGFAAFLGRFPKARVTLAVLANSEVVDATDLARSLWQLLADASEG